MKKARPLLLGLFAVVAVIGIILWLSLWKQQNTILTLSASPKSLIQISSEVESITAKRIAYSPKLLPSHQLPSSDLPQGSELPEFIVPDSHMGLVLSTLQPARAIDFEKEGYSPWVILGKLVLKCKGKRMIEIDIFLTHDGEPGAFGVTVVDPSLNHEWKYRANTTRQMWGVLIDAYVASRQH